MSFISFVIRTIAGLGIFEYGVYIRYIEGRLNNLWISWSINIAIWILFWSMLVLAEDLK